MWPRLRSLMRASAPTASPTDLPAATNPVERAEALWREAHAEKSPFRRDALHLEIAKTMVDIMGPELVAYCQRHVGDLASAEDVAQQSYIAFWQLLPRFEGRSSLRTFLFGIALNRCRRTARSDFREARRLQLHEDDIRAEIHPESLPTVDTDREHRDRVAILELTLTQMEPREAWLLRARLVEELPYPEMLTRYEARFGSGINTLEGLRSAFFRARRSLERLLGVQR